MQVIESGQFGSNPVNPLPRVSNSGNAFYGMIFSSPSLRCALLLALATCTFSSGADVTMQRVWPGYRTAESFTTLSDYFGGATSTTNQHALRTHPETREGFYWLTRFKSATLFQGSTVRVEVTRQGNTDPLIFDFDWDVPTGSNAIYIGLTGDDWADANEVPIAWRLSLIGPGGDLLTSSQSFLWDHPTS